MAIDFDQELRERKAKVNGQTVSIQDVIEADFQPINPHDTPVKRGLTLATAPSRVPAMSQLLRWTDG